MSHSNFAPPPNVKSRQDTVKDANSNNPYTPVEENDYLTKFMEGKISRRVKVYCSFTDSAQWHDMAFEGLVWGAGDDYLILYDEKKDVHTLIMAVYILYIEFSDIDNKK